MRLSHLALVGCTSITVSSAGTWSSAASLPQPLQELSGAVLKGKIYVAGGINTQNEGTTAAYRYDPAGDRWERIADIPDSRHHMPLVVVNDSLYLVGGYAVPGFTPTRSLFLYDEAHDQWLGRALLPEPRGASAADAVNGRIVVAGGTGLSGHVAPVAIYHPGSDSWSHGAPIPTLRDHLTGATVNGIFYAIAGRRNGNFDVVEAYDLASDSWTTRASMPSRRGGLGGAVLNGKIHTFGGEGPGTFSNHERYDPATNSWTVLPSLPTARHGTAVAAAGDRVYVIAGGPREGFSQTDIVEVFTP
jgi:N-acetylneuraminic acid mutarotase